MPYPTEILPQAGNKMIDCDISQRYLIRHVDVANPADLIDDETNLIKLEYLYNPSVRVVDLSMSLFGIFLYDHIRLDFTQVGKLKYMHYCEPNLTIQTPVEPEDYGYNNERSAWNILIAHVDGIKFEYKMGEDTLEAVCRVTHSPMRWNFWHFSLRWETNFGLLEDIEDEKLKNKIAKKLGHSVKAVLSKFAKITEPPNPEFNQGCYRLN